MLGLVSLGGSIWQAACGPAAQTPELEGELVPQLLLDVGSEVVSPAIADVQSALSELNGAVVDWNTAVLAGDDQSDAKNRAQDAWRSVTSAWQVLEVMQIGPAGSALTVVGGQDLRDEVYSWPTTNPCRVDQGVVSGVYADNDFFQSSLVNAYGIDALEHLLFSGVDNACPGQVAINSSGSWDALGVAEIDIARSSYALVVVDGMRARVDALQQVWDPDGENYAGQLAATDGTSPYESTQQALEAVFGALFYLEKMTKDEKLAVPLGLRDCADVVCPEAVEFVPSAHSMQAIEANLRGFRLLFAGGDGVGLDDYLIELGHESLATETLQHVDAASVLAAGFSGSLQETLVENPEAVEALYEELRAISGLLKGDLSTALRLQVPSEAAGDND